LNYFEKSMGYGNKHAQLCAAEIYLFGTDKNTKLDPKHAENIFEEMVKNKNDNAIYSLGSILLGGKTVFGHDPKKGFHLLKQAAKLGKHPDAIYEIGYCLEHGIGTDKNIEEAIKTYENAAEQDSGRALRTLGLFHLNGSHGIPKS